MKIAIDAHMLGDKSGGNETYYTSILENIPEFLSEKDEVHLLFKDRNEMKKWSKKGYEKIFCYMLRSKSSLKRYLIELPNYVKKYKIDILHTQYYLPVKTKSKTVVTIHDISYEHYPQYFKLIHVLRNKIWIKYAAKKSNAIFTVSEFSKRDISDKYKIDENKIFVTYNSAKPQFKKVKSKFELYKTLKKYSIEGDFILSVGNLQPRKNLINLIQAYVNLRENNREIKHKLVIVGKKAWKYSTIFQNILNSKYRDSIILTDYVSDKDLVLLYNASNLFVYPSFFEGFGLPPLEAMSCGTPVITSNITSLPEVVGEAALLIDPFKVDEIEFQMKRLIQSDKLRFEYSKRGIERAKFFSWRKTARKIVNVYQKIHTNSI